MHEGTFLCTVDVMMGTRDLREGDPPVPESRTVSSHRFQCQLLAPLLLRNWFIAEMLMSGHDVKFSAESK